MPGLLDTSVDVARRGLGLAEAASEASSDVARRRSAEKFEKQAGIGQALGTAVGYKLGRKRYTQPNDKTDTSSISQILGNVSQHLFNHWLPTHGQYTQYNMPTMPDQTISGLETTPQEGQE